MANTSNDSPPKPDWALTRAERRAAARAADGLPPRRRRWWPWLLLLALVVGGAAWYRTGGAALIEARLAAQQPAGQDEASAPEPEPAAPQMVQLTRSELMEVAPGTLRETVKVTGSLTPQRQLHISAEVSGRVVSVPVQQGDAVESGDLLVQIDIEQLQNQLQQLRATSDATQAQLRLARNQRDRTSSLVSRGLSPPSELEAGEANVDQILASLAAQQAQIENAERALEHATVTAPFAGIIAARSVDPGSYVSATAPLLTLVDLSSLEFEAILPVSYAPLVAPGQAVELSVEGLRDADLSGTLQRISPVAAEGSRMLPVFVSLRNADGRLRGGMFASGRLVLEQKEGVIGIPVEALREDRDGRHVLKRDGDRVVRQPVEVAREWDGGRLAEISSGLEAGDVIVSQALAQIRPGAEITVVD